MARYEAREKARGPVGEWLRIGDELVLDLDYADGRVIITADGMGRVETEPCQIRETGDPFTDPEYRRLVLWAGALRLREMADEMDRMLATTPAAILALPLPEPPEDP